MGTEWKIDNWFMKICFVTSSIIGILFLFGFVIGIILGIMGY